MAEADGLELLRGTRKSGGELTRLRLSHALGLEKAPAHLAVRAVAWVDDHLEVLVGAGRGRAVVLEILSREGDAEGLAVTGTLVLRYRGGALPLKLAAHLKAAFEARMARADLDRIAGALAEDPELGDGLPEGFGGAGGPADAADGGKRAEAAIVEEPPGEHEKQLKGARRAGGEASRKYLAELLGLEDAPEPFGVASLAWIDDHIELGVGSDDGREIRFAIHRRVPEARGFVMTARLIVSYQAKDIPDLVAKRIGGHAASRLGPLRLDDIAAELLKDPDLGALAEPMPSTENEHPDNQLDTWGGEDAYADFFAGGEIARSQLDSVDISRFSRNVQHCDLECLFVNPHSNAKVVNLVDFPWEDRVRNIGVPRWERSHKKVAQWDPNDSMVATDLGEQDVIRGNPEKLRSVLEHVVNLPNPQKKPLFVANTCVPTVTGEDVESVVKEFRAKSSFPILYLTVTPKSMNEVLVDLLVDTRLAAEAKAADPDPRSVNLIGFTEGRALQEIEELLASFGVRVNVCLLPAIEIELLERMPQAGLNVFYPNSLWENLYEQVRRDSRIPSIAPPAPFGFGGTRAWLAAVCEAVGTAPDFEARWEQAMAPHREAWDAAIRDLDDARVGMVIRGEEIHYLLDASQTWGIPVAGLCQEMGLGVEVFLSVRNEKAAARLTTQVRPLLDGELGSQVIPFSTFAEMREVLAHSECSALLTNHFYDWRVGEAGKNRFSLQHFEMGLAGAVRTARRLADLVEVPFFRRYGRYLNRTSEGLRDPLRQRVGATDAAAPEGVEAHAQENLP